jgi:hypothetical protein
LNPEHFMRLLTAVITVSAVALSTAGCDDPTGTGGSAAVERPAALQFLPAPANRPAGVPSSAVPVSWNVEPGPGTLIPPRVIDAPDSVLVGQAFTVTVYSMGVNACWQRVRDDVTIADSVATIRPIVRVENSASCVGSATLLAHPVRMTFARSGRGLLRAIGQRVDADGRVAPIDLTAQRVIVVR